MSGAGPRAWDAHGVQVPLAPLPAAETVSGTPRTGATALTRVGTVGVGVWVMTEGECTDVEADEVFVVLEGSGHLVVEDREEVPLAPGTVVRLHAGERTRWTVTSALRKLYVT